MQQFVAVAVAVRGGGVMLTIAMSALEPWVNPPVRIIVLPMFLCVHRSIIVNNSLLDSLVHADMQATYWNIWTKLKWNNGNRVHLEVVLYRLWSSL